MASGSRRPFLLCTVCAWVGIILPTAVFLPCDLIAQTRRGEEPQCQEECLNQHTEKMSLLSDAYSRTRNKKEYQDQVEHELQNYSRCLANCRELIPVK